MSFTRVIYDDCAYGTRLNENQNVLHYNLDTNKFYNCNQSRIDFGLLGGNQISQTTENLVDLESDLRNQTRLYSRCPTRKYRPTCDVAQCSNYNGYPCGDPKCQPNMIHMKENTLIDYRPRYNNVGYTLDGLNCGGSNPTMFSSKPNEFINNSFKYAATNVQGANRIPFGFKTL